MTTNNEITFSDHIVAHPYRYKRVPVPGTTDLFDMIPTWVDNPNEIVQLGTAVDRQLFEKLRGNVTRRSQVYTATANQTVFNLANAYLVDQGRLDVYISGVKQRSGADFTETSPTSFTLSEGVAAGTPVEAVYFSASQALSEDLIEQVQAAEAATLAANKAAQDASEATTAALTANLNWLEPVDNLSALNELSNPQTGDTRQTKDTGNVYRYDVSAWVLIQTMDPNAINALDTRLKSQLAENTKKLQPKFMHISCDDVITLFQDLTTNTATYTSIFNHPTFAFLKSMHDTYGMVFSGYVFYKYNASATFNLSQCTDKFASEFTANADWLKFGFHCNNWDMNYASTSAATAKADYELIMTQLFRILGSWECIDRVPRLQNYAGNFDSIKEMKNSPMLGILGLLSAEDTRTSYYHSAEQRDYLQTHDRLFDTANNLAFFSTDLRLENVSNLTTELNARKANINYSSVMNDLILFTHEEYLSQASMKTKIEQCCQFAVANGYKFDFPMNIVLNSMAGGVSVAGASTSSSTNGFVLDSFNRANASALGTTTTGQTWSNIGDGFKIENNKATNSSSPDLVTLLSVVETGLTNVAVSADLVRSDDTEALALVARCDGTGSNLIRVTLDNAVNNRINVQKIIGGVGTVIATYTYTFVNGTKYNLKFLCIGDTFKVLLDGTEVISIKDVNALVGNTKCGIRMYKDLGTSAGSFDNFQAIPV